MSLFIDSPSREDYFQITELWEASVRASHDFLGEADIQFFKPLILHEYLDAVDLYCVRDEQDKITGFIGLAEDKVEMLFVHPYSFGKGIGKFLLQFAISEKGVTRVDVNEQNPKAVDFYRHMGFDVTDRSETDGLGKPFPILAMKLQ
ncbi:GNAT family N-acetyltransferase [Dyadobacter diqingensis]|uniref:GNAT family N-acetyltransferase n=1 Tax=Dyadobacter diqingensis TaxID=2938121 RepID=UPI0020C1A9D7|nr:GNAT family N-acetyltransferase [Dyadobacter diqingensis]